MRHVLCICNSRQRRQVSSRDGGGRSPSQTAVKSQPPGNTRTTVTWDQACSPAEVPVSLCGGGEPRVGDGSARAEVGMALYKLVLYMA